MGGPAPRGDSASAISVFRHPLSRASPSTPGRGQWPRCTPAASPLVPAASSKSLPPRLGGVAGVDLPGTRVSGPPPSCSPADGIWAGSPFQLLQKVPLQTFVEEIHMDPSLGVELWTHGDTMFRLSGSTGLSHTHAICIPTSSVGAPTPQILAHTCCCRCFYYALWPSGRTRGTGAWAPSPHPSDLPAPSQASRPM